MTQSTKLERELEASVVMNEITGKAISLHETRGIGREIRLEREITQHSGALQFTEQQEEMIRANFSTGATKSEFEVLMAIAKARKLNPLLKQVYFVKRKDKKLNKDVWSVQVSIDGLRAIAERTGAYDGQDEPEFEHDKDGYITLARVKVYKKGVPRPFVGVARWSEYVQEYDGKPTKFWADMPYTMLGKCAEALAIRKAFPEDSGGLYVAEEMMQAESGNQLTGQAEPRQLPQRGAISPHGDDNGDGDPELAASLLHRLEQAMLPDGVTFEIKLDKNIETPLKPCATYDEALAMRAFLGTKAKQSEWAKAYQAARENMNTLQSKLLGKVWNHCDRQVAKLEKELKTDATASFVDADPEDDGR